MRHERLSLEDLELVRSIGTCGSLAGAVKALGVDHSSAFRRLAAIESRTDAALFRRSRRGYTPTDAGELVIVAAQRILADAEGLQRQLAGGDTRTEGRIRITVPDTLVRVTAGMCAAFANAHPALRCDLVVANAFSSLQQRDVDVALRASTSPPDGLSAKRIGPITTAAYAPVGEKSGAVLPDGRWIGFDESLSHLSSARWLREHVPDAAIVMRVNALPAALAACQAGIGRALLPAYFGDAAGGVERLSIALPDIRTDLWFATHPDLRRSARVRLLWEFAAGWLPSRIAGT